MKGKNLTKILLSILLVLISIVVIIVAFVGIYMPKANKLKNIIPDYKLGTEVDGIIEYRLVPDDSEEEKEVYVDSKGNIKGFVEDGSESTDSSVQVTTDLQEAESDSEETNDTGFEKETRTIRENEKNVLTESNFEKSKAIIEERLENAGATEYSIRLDKNTGDMVVELSQNDDVSYLYQVALSSFGEFDIIDYQTGVVLMDKSNLKDAQVATNFNQETNKYDIYLQLTLDEKGKEIIKEISKQYIEYTDSEGNEKTDRISIRVDGKSVMTTYFGEEYDDYILNIPISTDVVAENMNDYVKSVDDVAFLLRQDTIPVKYVQDGGALYIESGLAKNVINVFYWSIIIILVVILVFLFIKYGSRGFLAGIMNACLIGLVVIVLKYVKIVISISSLIALYGVVILNFVFLFEYLKRLKEENKDSYFETIKKYYSITFPVIVVSFIFTFFVSATVTGLGSVLFWGMLLQLIYNTVIVKYVLEGGSK